jgi:hypothetical protein
VLGPAEVEAAWSSISLDLKPQDEVEFAHVLHIIPLRHLVLEILESARSGGSKGEVIHIDTHHDEVRTSASNIDGVV